MVYEEALEIARVHNPRIDYCEERKFSYLFDSKREGGGSPLVVMKDSGRCLKYIAYLHEIDFREDPVTRKIRV